MLVKRKTTTEETVELALPAYFKSGRLVTVITGEKIFHVGSSIGIYSFDASQPLVDHVISTFEPATEAEFIAAYTLARIATEFKLKTTTNHDSENHCRLAADLGIRIQHYRLQVIQNSMGTTGAKDKRQLQSAQWLRGLLKNRLFMKLLMRVIRGIKKLIKQKHHGSCYSYTDFLDRNRRAADQGGAQL